MTIKKWCLVGGQLYRFSEIFDNGHDAVLHARLLKDYRSVFVSRTKDGRWAVYWKVKTEDLPKTAGLCSI